MASTSSTDSKSFVPEQLRYASYADEWLQVDVADIGGARPLNVLRAEVALPPLVGVADPAGKLGDLVATYRAMLHLVSPRFVEVVAGAGLSGWQVTPVEIEGNKAVADLSLLQSTGRCGPIDRTGAVPRLDMRTWDGSDFFVPQNQGSVLLSPRAASVLRAAKLRNVAVEASGLELASRWRLFGRPPGIGR